MVTTDWEILFISGRAVHGLGATCSIGFSRNEIVQCSVL